MLDSLVAVPENLQQVLQCLPLVVSRKAGAAHAGCGTNPVALKITEVHGSPSSRVNGELAGALCAAMQPCTV